MRSIWGDNDGDLEVPEIFDFSKCFRVFVYSFLDEINPLVFQGALRETARLAERLRVDSDQLEDPFKEGHNS